MENVPENKAEKEAEKKVNFDREMATQNYDQWSKTWKVGRNMRHATGKDQTEFEQHKQEIISLIEDGFLLYDESDKSMNYLFQFPEDASDETQIKLKMPKGAALVAGDQYEEKQHVKKAQTFLEQMSGKAPVFFSKLNFIDLQDLYKVMNHFLGS